MKFDYHPQHNESNHYLAIMEDTGMKPTLPQRNVTAGETGYESITPSPTTPTSSPEDYIKISQASTILEHDVDLTSDVVEDFIQEKNQRTKSNNKQRKKRCNRMDMSLLKQVMPQEVEELPWDIYGNVIFKMKCEQDFWVDSVCDGCWWKVVQSSRKDLQGEREFATCLGSYICNNPECPKYTTEKVKNLMDFKCGPKGSYTCKICGYYVARVHCGTLKAVEYDEECGYITIYHTGNHICNVKPEKVNQLKFACKELLNHDLYKTPRELKYGVIGYYLNEGDVDKAYEVAQKMDDDSIIEKFRHLGKSSKRNDSKERQIDSFSMLRN